MIALLSVWISLMTLLGAALMLIYRPAMTDNSIVAILYFGAPGSLCLAGMVLWAYRKEGSDDEGIVAQRMQAKVAIALAVAAAAIVYGLIIASQKLEPIEGSTAKIYNPPGRFIAERSNDPRGRTLAHHHAIYFERQESIEKRTGVRTRIAG